MSNNNKSFQLNCYTKVVGEITIWRGHSPEQVKAMKDGLAKLKEQGIEAIEVNPYSFNPIANTFHHFFKAFNDFISGKEVLFVKNIKADKQL